MNEAYITLTVLALSIFFFANGKMRSDIVALCSLVALLVFDILTPEEALSGFSNSVIIMMVGLFVVGGAIFQTGLAKMIGSRLMRLSGGGETRLFLIVMLVTSAIGGFVSNTGTVALLMPIVVSMAMSMKMYPGRLLMPLAFASSMGGMMTLIGTPPNLVINEALVKAGYGSLSFFSFFPVGIICVAVGIIVLLPLSKKYLSKSGSEAGGNENNGKSLKELVKEYGVVSSMYRLTITEKSRAAGQKIFEMDVRNRFGINILEVRRTERSQTRLLKNVVQKAADPDMQLEVGDIIIVNGNREYVDEFAEVYNLNILPEEEKQDSLDFYEIGVAEIVLMPTSTIVNKTIREVGFRTKYNVNVLGICRDKKYIMTDFVDEKIHSGDVLLVQGTWVNIAEIEKEDTEWVVMGRPMEAAEKVTLDYKAPLAAVIMLLMVAAMVFDFIPIAPVTAVMIAGLLMVLSGCFRNVEAAYKTINWQSVVLIAAMMPMSTALEKTGVSAYLSSSLVNTIGALGPHLLLAGIYFTTSLMTMFLSNTATAVLMAPIALSCAIGVDVNPIPFLFAVSIAASMCFASPFSTPPNALVMPAGHYTFMDYIKVGLPLQIVMGIVMVFALPLLFPF